MIKMKKKGKRPRQQIEIRWHYGAVILKIRTEFITSINLLTFDTQGQQVFKKITNKNYLIKSSLLELFPFCRNFVKDAYNLYT